MPTIRRKALLTLNALVLAFSLLDVSFADPSPGSLAPGIPSFAPVPGPLAPTSSLPGQEVLPGLRRYHRTDLDPNSLLARVRGFDRGSFRLDLGTRVFDLELERFSIRSPGYVVRHLTARGVIEVPATPEQSFRGKVRGRPGSKVRLSFQDGRVNGFVDEGDGDRTYVEPMDHFRAATAGASAALRGAVPHVTYRESDVLPEAGVRCGTPGASALPTPGSVPPFGQALPAPGAGPAKDLAIPVPHALPKAAASANAAEPCALVEIAVGIDYSMVRGLGTAAAAEKRITDIYNMVDGLYQDPAINLHVRISELFIETSQTNTWGSTMDINQYLNAFTPWMRGANGFKKPFDVGAMWYYSLGGGTVGLAWVGVVCNNNRSNVIRYFTATSRSMMIDAAHELGHNFGANHIENPNWVMNPAITGSNDKWDPTTINSIVNHKKSRSCLSACNVAPIAGFSVQGATACADTRTFTDQSVGEPTSWLWRFGDGATSTLKSPTHTYAAPGKYTVSLSATNAFGVDTALSGILRVKPIPAPIPKDGDACAPSAVVLEAQGTGTLRWYDSASGGMPLFEGPRYTTPVLSKARAYYVEDGEADLPVTKVGPVGPSIGPGQMFTNNGDRRLFFDVHRSATLVSAKVSAGSAGPRLIEILDSKDKRIASKTVQIPAGESRVALGFTLPPGVDYALKGFGSGDSLNLFRNASGADYPYFSPDTLVTITGSDATAADSVTQSGYYYYFYDWEIRETGCASPRVAVQAKLNCTSNLASAPGSFTLTARPQAGTLLLQGFAPEAKILSITLRSVDGALVHRSTRSLQAGAFSIPIPLSATRLLTVDLSFGPTRKRLILPAF